MADLSFLYIFISFNAGVAVIIISLATYVLFSIFRAFAYDLLSFPILSGEFRSTLSKI